MEPCDACAAGKSKQKNISRKSEHKPATNKGSLIYIDIIDVNNPKNLDINITKPHCKFSGD